ncbi:hypothetical protein [Siphonobacter sp. SORGH_AS_1065]|uniref:hypothetical protein n=1 Tax=Siphonobacter sp. SORGH_AS_1065 TaxID=3041795 RepID=UPI002785C7CF|nr:hypothetical protein [Siphonobacter sp. SORGH_AS_1065]MDQ1089747.1 hypothetical protein [Siphonobacter sp. SORGH_AS_1065]
MVKSLFLFLLLFPIIAKSQEVPIEGNNATDSLIVLKSYLTKVQSAYDNIKELSKSIPAAGEAHRQQIASTMENIKKRQLESVKICAIFNTLFASGSSNVDIILASLNTGITLGKMTTPFVAPTFRNSYDNWIGKWGKYLPSIALPLASMFSKNENFKVASVSVGMSLTALINILSRSDKDRNKDVTQAFTNVTETIDLFDFNRAVYGDIEKLQTVIKSVISADSTLSKDYNTFFDENKDLFTKTDSDLVADSRYTNFIEKSRPLMDRFQSKLIRINYVLDYAEGMIKSYEIRSNYINNQPIPTSTYLESYSSIKKDTYNAINDLNKIFKDNKERWNSLQSRYYKLTPSDTKKLELFSDLEEIKKTLQ